MDEKGHERNYAKSQHCSKEINKAIFYFHLLPGEIC